MMELKWTLDSAIATVLIVAVGVFAGMVAFALVGGQAVLLGRDLFS